MRFDTKIAIVVRQDLAAWQKLNVTAFLAGGIVGANPELAGEAYVDGSGQGCGPLIRQPVLFFRRPRGGVDPRPRPRPRPRAQTFDLHPGPVRDRQRRRQPRAAVPAVATAALDLVGLGLHASGKDVDRVTKGLALHA
jgi:hypothetical protein